MTHPMVEKLRDLIQQKQSNLALSLDVTKKSAFLEIADELGPEICILKSHIDIIEDFDQDLIIQLRALAKKHQFLLFEDRKFADIGETVKHQFAQGVFRIREWADIINAHGITGPGIIDSLKSVARKDTGLLMLAQLSAKDNLLTSELTQTILSFAEKNPDYVMGFIAQQRLNSSHDFIYMTPGVHLDKSGDNLDQQYRTPEQAIIRDGCDIIIVGRAIYEAENPLEQAKRYKKSGWQALMAR